MSGARLRLVLVLKADILDVSRVLCQRALGVFGKRLNVYERLRQSKYRFLRLPRCRTAGVFQCGIILRTGCWTTCSAVSRRGLSYNTGVL
jgi:hypothetical protein